MKAKNHRKMKSSKRLKRNTSKIFLILFLAIGTIVLAWFLTWYRTNFRGKAAGRSYPRPVKVMLVKYLPDGANQTTENLIKERINTWEAQMEAASKYHGYKDSAAPAVIDVQVRAQHVTRYTDPPLVQGNDRWDTSNKSFKAIVEANNNQVCDIINAEQIDQVWYVVTPVNNGGYIGEYYWSNAFSPNANTLCGGKRTFISLSLDAEPSSTLNLHVLGHYLEAMIGDVQTRELFEGRFTGTGNIWGGLYLPPVYTNDKVCGDVHYSPNATEFSDDYDYYQSNSITGNMCEDWHPDYAQAQKQTVSSADWNCTATACPAQNYLKWWFNNMPGKDVNLQYQGKRLPPWFEFLSDFDDTIAYYASNPNYFLAPQYQDAAQPDYISNKSKAQKSGGTSINWNHQVSGADRLLVVALSYRSPGSSDSIKVSNANFGGTPLIYIRRDRYGEYASELWYLSNPPTGTKTVTVNFAASADSIVGTGTTFIGVNTTNPIRLNTGAGSADASSPNQTGNQNITVAGQSGDYLFTVLTTYSSGNTVTRTGKTAGIWGVLQGNVISKGGTQRQSDSVTLQWTSTKNWPWAASGIAIKPKGSTGPTPTPTTSPTNNGLTGKYYDTASFTTLKLTRVDPRIAFNWAAGAPNASINANTFSVRWTGFIKAPVTGKYTFTANVDDGVRVWVNNTRIINSWTNKTAVANAIGTISLTKGQKYPIRVDYYENTANASISLSWAYPGVTKRIVPTAWLFVK